MAQPPISLSGDARPTGKPADALVPCVGGTSVTSLPAATAASFASALPSVGPVVSIAAVPDQLAYDVGRAMVRQLVAGGNEVHIRLEPVQFGRIDVRLSFDDLGTLRAVVAAETGQVLDLLRRDSADLGRALADAGVRSDSQSFRFEDRSGDQRQHRAPPQQAFGAGNEALPDAPDAPGTDRFVPLRWRGRMNIIA